MQRLSDGQHVAVRPGRTPAGSRHRGPGRPGRPGEFARWFIPLALMSALAGVGVVMLLGTGARPASHPAAESVPVSRAVAALDLPAYLPVYLANLKQRTFRGGVVVPTPAAPVKSPSAAVSPKPAAAPTHAPAPAPVTAAGAPAPTAEYQTPRGANELAWSEAILRALGDPLTNANIVSMGYWMQNEAGTPPHGIVGANNPINVSQPGFGGWPIKSEGNGYNLYSYPSPQAGIQALVKYINPYGYPQILAALKSGAGLSSPSLAGELSEYSGGGYTTIPDAWGASQGTPQT
jgi:hypothetical protein